MVNMFSFITTTVPPAIKFNGNPIKPVSPEEFSGQLISSGDTLLQVLGSLVIPIVAISVLISIIVYISGGILHSEKIRKSGAAGILAAFIGFFIYALSPYIMGLLYTISNNFNH